MLEDMGFDRDVIQPIVTFGKDHVRLDFPPAGGVLALKRDLIVPYSTIKDVRVEEHAPWPHPFHMQRIGTHAPGLACFGKFWVNGEKRFYFFAKNDRVLDLHLTDHPYGRIVIGMKDPEVLAADIKEQLPGARGSETQSF